MSKEGMFIIYCLEEYKNANSLTGQDALTLFNKYSVFDYIKEFYPVLHTMGSKYITNDIDEFINFKRGEEKNNV